MPKFDLSTSIESSSANPVTLPENTFLDMPSRDVLLRLLEVQPHKRLRTIRTLGTIAFYKGFNFDDVKNRKIKPKDLLVAHFGEDFNKPKESEEYFEGFDETFIAEYGGTDYD